jgi:aminoglycoside 3-N-acetyltransferase
MTALYSYNNRNITEADLLQGLHDVGVAQGDTIFVHSDIRTFGKPLLFGDELFARLVGVLELSVGKEGTVAMPTFSYSWGKGEVYDPAITPSTVGALTNYFRKQPGVVRSMQPFLSVAARGPQAQRCMRAGSDSFGEESIFATLRDLDAVLVYFGVTLGHSSTFLHYLEQEHKVPYRYMKSFKGTYIDQGVSKTGECTFYVRKLDADIENDLPRIEPWLREHNVLREVHVGGIIASTRARDLYTQGMAYLDTDPLGLLLQP